MNLDMFQSLVFILQLHCGSQQIGDTNLAYGTLVYLDISAQVPRVAHFQRYLPTFGEHPFCPGLREAMDLKAHVLLDITAANELQSFLNLSNQAGPAYFDTHLLK